MTECFTQLESEYCPPLDPALLSAILSDYDLSNDAALKNARSTLDALRESALVEEGAGFDPSGTGAQDERELTVKKATSSPEASESQSRETDMTSLSNDFTSFEIDDYITAHVSHLPVGTGEDLENLDEVTKVKLLCNLFGDRVSNFSAQHTLRKCGGKWQTAMEELLTHVYFNETEKTDDGNKVAAKGIDAFSEDNIAPRKKRGKRKNQRLHDTDVGGVNSWPSSGSDNAGPTTNKWHSSTTDIDFITSRIPIAKSIVKSTYHEQGASLSKTINTLLEASAQDSKVLVTNDVVVEVEVDELQLEFPSIARENLATLVRLTHPLTASARELAEALVSKRKVQTVGGIELIPVYAPLNGSCEELPVISKTDSPVSLNGLRSETMGNAEQARIYATMRASALAQASAAHRKAKSNRLMGGAAAYYSQVYRDQSALLSHHNAAAADDVAAVQSSSTQVDLHGIDVLNGVRIAQQKVNAWWDGLGENRVNGRLGAGARASGYTIVVGAGRHSEGGKSKLGPAVSKMLRDDGWKIESAGAVIIVKGRDKK